MKVIFLYLYTQHTYFEWPEMVKTKRCLIIVIFIPFDVIGEKFPNLKRIFSHLEYSGSGYYKGHFTILLTKFLDTRNENWFFLFGNKNGSAFDGGVM